MKCNLNSPAEIKIKVVSLIWRDFLLIRYINIFFMFSLSSLSLKLKRPDNVLTVRVYVCVRARDRLRSSDSVSSGRPRGQKRSRPTRCLKTARPVCVCSSLCVYSSGLSLTPSQVWNVRGAWVLVGAAALGGRRLLKGGAYAGASSRGTGVRWGRRQSGSPSCCSWQLWNRPWDTHACSAAL